MAKNNKPSPKPQPKPQPKPDPKPQPKPQQPPSAQPPRPQQPAPTLPSPAPQIPPKPVGTPPPPPKPVSPPTPPPKGDDGSGGERWRQFKSGYKDLKNPQDKEFIRKIFGGAPQDDRLASWKVLSDQQKDALANSVKNNVISDNEKKKLRSLFSKDAGGGSGGGGGGGGTGGGGGNITPEPIDEDIPEDNLPPSPTEEDDGDEPARGGPNPTVKGGSEKIKIPKNEPITNYAINKKSEDRITMPNLDKKIFKEIQRITKNLISSTKEFIEGGINYDGIDYIPDNEVLTEDGKSLFNFTDFNAPGTLNSGLADQTMAQITEAIQKVLNRGIRGNKDYNYKKYIDLFELRYNNDGTPYYRFSLELVGELTDEITLTYLKN